MKNKIKKLEVRRRTKSYKIEADNKSISIYPLRVHQFVKNSKSIATKVQVKLGLFCTSKTLRYLIALTAFISCLGLGQYYWEKESILGVCYYVIHSIGIIRKNMN